MCRWHRVHRAGLTREPDQTSGGYSFVCKGMAAFESFLGSMQRPNARSSATHFKMHDLPPLVSQSRQFRKTNAPHIVPRHVSPIAPRRPSPNIVHDHHSANVQKRRCALQRISDSRRVAQNVSALDSKSQFAVSTACACGGAAAKCLSSQSSVPRRAAVPPQPCTPWRLAWYAG